jgi:CheY-like chemotaxis protein
MATVRDMGGHLDVTSEVGVGTTFRVHVPRFAGRAPEPALDQPASADEIGSVLVVEDERLVRRAVERILAKFCRRVVTAEDAPGALAILETEHGAFDVVLLDLSMPRMSGKEMLAKIRERWPELPVVIMSGNTSDRAGLEGATDILDKPLTAGPLKAALLDAIKRR